ncbi:NAD-dependent epimerase/dehydratase family protein [Halieaceae bacterium IMCC14734]|uniref:NAD-dependent epimerase/dehydratase family protein n=1 Tax=Candidatus Litorirhabdus singularis TaxID=2518993 RepID=A0ABT3TBT0_9GAMM|nr:NAD-dependent epimerase/dehydratase family protein [Candidatus Litorirhabdus singularis]MCX2979732.1 NAD-dependent epimerase/dehydratase family protein [Candidatus Litorirhabdus singularis]
MRIMITGGTGFVGYHTATALLKAGHELSLLVRSEDKMRRLFGDQIEHFTQGDITDEASVAAALAGCDGVVHAAAMVSIDQRDAQLVRDTNVGGTRQVIGGAIAAGVENIIHVSSVTALYDPGAAFLNEHSPPGKASNAYGASKVECEIYVRELQDAGAPIHITYPGSIIGPDDPALTEPHQGLKTYLNGLVPVMPSGNQWVDVRDVALAHQRLLEGTLTSGRYTLGGHFVPWTQLVDIISAITGRKLRKVPVPASAMRGLGRLMDKVNQWRDTPIDIPVTYEAMVYATNWVRMDDSKAMDELDLEFRPVEESMSAAIRWLLAAGHISEQEAGILAD